jgi:hypothetical protein
MDLMGPLIIFLGFVGIVRLFASNIKRDTKWNIGGERKLAGCGGHELNPGFPTWTAFWFHRVHLASNWTTEVRWFVPNLGLDLRMQKFSFLSFLEGELTSFYSLFVHNTTTAFLASNRLPRLDRVIFSAIWKDRMRRGVRIRLSNCWDLWLLEKSIILTGA